MKFVSYISSNFSLQVQRTAVVKGKSGSIVDKFSMTTMLQPRCDSCKVTFRHFHRCCKLIQLL